MVPQQHSRLGLWGEHERAAWIPSQMSHRFVHAALCYFSRLCFASPPVNVSKKLTLISNCFATHLCRTLFGMLGLKKLATISLFSCCIDVSPHGPCDHQWFMLEYRGEESTHFNSRCFIKYKEVRKARLNLGNGELLTWKSIVLQWLTPIMVR